MERITLFNSMLSKIIQESVDEASKELVYTNEYGYEHQIPKIGEVKKCLISSQISLLEAVKKELQETEIESNNIDFVNGFVRANNENIQSLEEQIAEIKKLI